METYELGRLGAILDGGFVAIREASSLDDLWKVLTQSYGALGFGAVAYLLLDGADSPKPAVVLQRGFSSAVVQKFAELGYGRAAPLLRIALATAQPLLASEVARDERMSPAEAQHHQAMLDAGITDALALPLYGPLGREAIVFLAEPDDPSLFDGGFRTAAHMIGQAAHLRLFALHIDHEPKRHELSARETEILRWVAQGKSNSDIADIIGIGASTVDTYLRRLFDKLGVTDRTSASVKGITLGIIRI